MIGRLQKLLTIAPLAAKYRFGAIGEHDMTLTPIADLFVVADLDTKHAWSAIRFGVPADSPLGVDLQCFLFVLQRRRIADRLKQNFRKNVLIDRFDRNKLELDSLDTCWKLSGECFGNRCQAGGAHMRLCSLPRSLPARACVSLPKLGTRCDRLPLTR